MRVYGLSRRERANRTVHCMGVRVYGPGGWIDLFTLGLAGMVGLVKQHGTESDGQLEEAEFYFHFIFGMGNGLISGFFSYFSHIRVGS